ncbi:MAG: hypothetical protein ACOVKS_05905 [Aquimonas sp.]|jgi:hypothetical protein
MILLRSLAITLLLAMTSASAQDRPAAAASAPVASEQQAARAAFIRERIEARRRNMQINARGEVRALREPLFDGYVLEFEHNLLFEDVREQAGFQVREYELALRLVEPRMAIAQLMQRLLDAGFKVESPIGPPEARVLRFWRQGRSVEDARFSVHLGERPLGAAPSPVEQGATGVLILRLYQRRSD